MKLLLIVTIAASLLGCTHHVYLHKSGEFVQDTLIILDTVCPAVIIIRDTIIPDTVRTIDTVLKMPLNPWPGFISHLDSWQGDSLKRVWLQWGENGSWHQYLLNDTCR